MFLVLLDCYSSRYHFLYNRNHSPIKPAKEYDVKKRWGAGESLDRIGNGWHWQQWMTMIKQSHFTICKWNFSKITKINGHSETRTSIHGFIRHRQKEHMTLPYFKKKKSVHLGPHCQGVSKASGNVFSNTCHLRTFQMDMLGIESWAAALSQNPLIIEVRQNKSI